MPPEMFRENSVMRQRKEISIIAGGESEKLTWKGVVEDLNSVEEAV